MSFIEVDGAKDISRPKKLGPAFYLTAGTIFLLVFLYFHELGFFTRFKLPIEYIELEILNSIQYLPLYIIALATVNIFMLAFGSKISASEFIVVRRRTFHVLFGLMGIMLIPALIIKSKIVFLVFVFSFAQSLFWRSIGGTKYNPVFNLDLQNVQHLAGMLLIVLTFCSIVSFWMGYLERSFLYKGHFEKVNSSKVLLRKYSEYSIYSLASSKNTSDSGIIIIIEYVNGKCDSLNYKRSLDK